MLIVRFLKRLFSLFAKHPRGVIAGAAAAGAAGVAAGGIQAHKAKKINKRALEIQNEALEKHDRAYSETQQVLSD